MMIDSKTATLTELREWLADVIRHNPKAGQLWDLITCLRGPDTPSETAEMKATEHEKAYRARRKRKRQTVEVIRGKAFFGAVGGSARSRDDINYVTLPPQHEWDHFDKHVERAAGVLGLTIKYLKPRRQRKKDEGEPEWEILAEGKANGVPVKKEKLAFKAVPSNGSGVIDWDTIVPPKSYPAWAAPPSTKPTKPTWPVTETNLQEIGSTFKAYPNLPGVDVVLNGKVYYVTKEEYLKEEKAMKQMQQANLNSTQEPSLDDIPF